MSDNVDPFMGCRLPLGAYQQATFVNLPDEGQFDPYWTPPVYTVEFQSANGFQTQKATLRLDLPAIDKLIVALQAAAHPTPDNIASLEALMQTQKYGEFIR
jgi:hypothetical protein